MALQIIDSYPSLSDVENEIFSMSESVRKGWYILGCKLHEVESQQLYKQSHHRHFTSWLHSISKVLELEPSTLWKYLKIVRMTSGLGISSDEINLRNVTGLEQIARIYGRTSDPEQALELIEDLNTKAINISEIRELAKSISATVEHQHREKPSASKSQLFLNSTVKRSLVIVSYICLAFLIIYLVKPL